MDLSTVPYLTDQNMFCHRYIPLHVTFCTHACLAKPVLLPHSTVVPSLNYVNISLWVKLLRICEGHVPSHCFGYLYQKFKSEDFRFQPKYLNFRVFYIDEIEGKSKYYKL